MDFDTWGAAGGVRASRPHVFEWPERLRFPTRLMVMQRTNASRIADAAIASGDLTLLRRTGIEKVRHGVTTFVEVLRATKA